ncbi:hypothetical protein VPH35_037838 [Triticum aestivum]|uniref:uncharacterized protein n=1 Tax=Triticum aestivum TaxID=4565 RepID=UPI001D012A12|nr:uncharacterized protein LOC123049424 [Triticum aestivum]
MGMGGRSCGTRRGTRASRRRCGGRRKRGSRRPGSTCSTPPSWSGCGGRDGGRVGAGQVGRGDDEVMEGVCRVWSGCQDLAAVWVVEPQGGVTEATTNPQQPAVAASGRRHTGPPTGVAVGKRACEVAWWSGPGIAFIRASLSWYHVRYKAEEIVRI